MATDTRGLSAQGAPYRQYSHPSFQESPHAVGSRWPGNWDTPGQALPSLLEAKYFVFGPKVPKDTFTLPGQLGWDSSHRAESLVGTLEIQELAFLAPNLRIFLGENSCSSHPAFQEQLSAPTALSLQVSPGKGQAVPQTPLLKSLAALSGVGCRWARAEALLHPA